MIELSVIRTEAPSGVAVWRLEPSAEICLGAVGSNKVEQLHVSLPEEWEDYTVRITFIPRDRSPVGILLPAGGVVDITSDIVSGKWGTGEYVIDAVQGDRVAYTVGGRYTAYNHPKAGGGPQKNTPSEYHQILSAIAAGMVKGDPGETPYIGGNGNWFVGDVDTGIKAQGPKGDKGDAPVRGEDYWTDEDQSAIVATVLERVPEVEAVGALADRAETAATKSEAAQTSAETAQDKAEAASASASQSASSSIQAADQAETSAATAVQAAEDAGRSADKAEESAQRAETAAFGAEESAAAAKGSESAAAVSETAAKASETAAANSAGQAAESASSAATAAANAEQSASEAESAAAEAQDTVAAVRPELDQLNETLTANAKADAVTKRSLDALWKLNQGISYQFETDDTEAYRKIVPSGAKLASVESIGGRTIVWNQLIKNGNFEGADGWSTIYNPFTVENNTLTCTIQKVNAWIAETQVTLKSGHKCLLIFDAKCSQVSDGLYYYLSNHNAANYVTVGTDLKTYSVLFTAKSDLTGVLRFYEMTTVDITYEIKNVMLVDLTSIDFENITTVKEFKAMFPKDYYPYNSGELVSAQVNQLTVTGKNVFPDNPSSIGGYGSGYYGFEIKGLVPLTAYTVSVSNTNFVRTYGKVQHYGGETWIGHRSSDFDSINAQNPRKIIARKDGAVTFLVNIYEYSSTEDFMLKVRAIWKDLQIEIGDKATGYSPYNKTAVPISAAVLNLPGYGWSAGTAHNSIERTENGWQYVQRVDSRAYQDGDTVTDGVISYYVLDTPVMTDITDLMNGALDAIPVEAGGTLTFENASALPVPSSVEYLISLAEVNGR